MPPPHKQSRPGDGHPPHGQSPPGDGHPAPGAGRGPGDPAAAGAQGSGPGRPGNGIRPGGPVPGRIIPLVPGTARPRGERLLAMREAVVQVIGHLVLKSVPPGRRSPLFGQAAALLGEAGWGLDELYEAAEEGPARDALFEALGLSA
jgi:hypothetical protein